MWINDITELQANPFDVIPNHASFGENVNSITRFVIIFFTLLAIIRGQAALLITMVLVIAVIAIFSVRYETHNCVSARERQLRQTGCIKPTRQNPFMNNLDNSNSRPCNGMENAATRLYKNEFVFEDLDDKNTKIAERNFYTLPNGGIPNFGEFSRGLVIEKCDDAWKIQE